MKYEKKFTKPYPNGYKDKPDLTTPVKADILNMQDETFEAIEDFLANLNTTDLTDDVAIKKSLTVGSRNKATGDYTVSHGENCEASSPCSHAEGSSCIASEQASHAEGTRTTASGSMAHSEGNETIASGTISHAEGYKTIASGVSSHAEGISTKANGYMAHSEGNTTVADGAGSHAEGYGTKATADFQHVQGKYNLEDTEKKYAHIVGGGSSDSDRKNIHTIDWNGNAEFAGDVTNGNGVSLDGLDGKIAELASSGISRLIVDSLPTEDIKTNVIYFLPLSSVGENNIYEEYMYINEKWELIGTTHVDLSQYYTKEESDDLLAEKANKTAFENHANDKDIHVTAAEKKKYITADVDNLVNYYDKTTTDQKLADIGLTDYLKKTGDSSNTTVAFTEPTTLSEPTTKEKLSSIIGKVSLTIKNLKTLITLMGTTDITSIGDGTVTNAIDFVNKTSFQQSLFDLADNCNIIYSNTSGDVVDVAGRKAKRESSEPCLWLMFTGSSKEYYGWMCIGLTEEAVTLTSQTGYGGSDLITHTNSGYSYYISIMTSKLPAGNAMTLTTNGKTKIISTDNAIVCDPSSLTLKELSAYAAKIKDFATNTALAEVNSNLNQKQDSSTAITTENIGSQSVNYATYSEHSNKATQIENFSDFEYNQSTEAYGKECTWYDKNGLRVGAIVPHCTGNGITNMLMVSDRGKICFPNETFISSIHLGNDTNFIYKSDKETLWFRYLKEDGTTSYISLETIANKAISNIIRKEFHYTGNISTNDNIKIPISIPTGYHILDAVRAWTSGFVGSCYIESFNTSYVSVWVTQGNNGARGSICVSILFESNT